MGVKIEGVDPFYFVDLPYDRQLALLAYYEVSSTAPKASKHTGAKAVAAENAQHAQMRADLEANGSDAAQIDKFMKALLW